MYLSRIRRLGVVVRGVATACLAVLLVLGLPSPGHSEVDLPGGLRIEVFDVGQGDAILFRPPNAAPVLVDGGPPGAGLERKLKKAGVEELAAAVVTHPQSDHMGGIEELLGGTPVRRLLFARLSRRLIEKALAAGTEPQRIAAGQELRAGRLRLRVLWPPPELSAGIAPEQDPNQLSLVMEARWRHFTMLLTGDAEAEAVPIEPGPADVLKVAHHGSADAGLGPLLGRVRPRLAVISVGEENSYGHPAPATLASLARYQVPTLRTDRDGAIVIDVEPQGFSVDR